MQHLDKMLQSEGKNPAGLALIMTSDEFGIKHSIVCCISVLSPPVKQKSAI